MRRLAGLNLRFRLMLCAGTAAAFASGPESAVGSALGSFSAKDKANLIYQLLNQFEICDLFNMMTYSDITNVW